MTKLRAFFVKGWKMVFTWESFFERGFRALIMVLATSGLTFADQVASLLGEPGWAKGIRMASLGATGLSLLIAAGQKNPPATPPPSSSGFARLWVLFVMALAAAAALACSGDTVRAAFGVQPASAMVSPGALVQFEVLSAPAPVTWTVVENGGGTVSSTGLYAAPPCPTTGTFHIQAAAGGKTAQAAATVADGIVSLTVSPPTVTLAPGQSQQFTATQTTGCGTVTTAALRVTAPAK